MVLDMRPQRDNAHQTRGQLRPGDKASTNWSATAHSATLVPMMHALRQLSQSSRPLWVLLLMAFVWQPALLAASEVHAFAHQAETGHAHDVDHHTHIAADEHASTDGDLWHSLLHMDQCCAHVPVMPSDVLPLPLMFWSGAAPSARLLAMQSLTLPFPLRPPIQG